MKLKLFILLFFAYVQLGWGQTVISRMRGSAGYSTFVGTDLKTQKTLWTAKQTSFTDVQNYSLVGDKYYTLGYDLLENGSSRVGVECFDLKSGKIAWKYTLPEGEKFYPYPPSADKSTVTFFAGSNIAGSHQDMVFINAATGKLKGRLPIPNKMRLAEGAIYPITSHEGSVFCLMANGLGSYIVSINTNSSSVNWVSKKIGFIPNQILVGNGKIVMPLARYGDDVEKYTNLDEKWYSRAVVFSTDGSDQGTINQNVSKYIENGEIDLDFEVGYLSGDDLILINTNTIGKYNLASKKELLLIEPDLNSWWSSRTTGYSVKHQKLFLDIDLGPEIIDMKTGKKVSNPNDLDEVTSVYSDLYLGYNSKNDPALYYIQNPAELKHKIPSELGSIVTVLEANDETSSTPTEKGIDILSPLVNAEFVAGQPINILTKKNENSLATYYEICLYKIGSDVKMACQSSSNFIKESHSYTIPEYITPGEYELRITSRSTQEVSGSVKIVITKGKYDCVLNAPQNISLRKGITILTHGFSPTGNFFGIIDGMYENARIIRKRISGNNIEQGKGATIYTNDENGKWIILRGENGYGDPNEEIILIYDWQSLSNKPFGSYGTGYLEAAADNLFAMLINASGKLNGNLISNKPVHMIGHSRGTVMLLQVLHRIGHYFPNIKIEQLTTLDPHPATTFGDVVFNQRATFSSLPGLTSKIVDDCTGTIGCGKSMGLQLRIPENVIFSDSYFRQDGTYEGAISDGKILPFIGSFDGVSVEGIQYRELNNEKIKLCGCAGLAGGTHSGIVTWYFGTVEKNDVDSDSHNLVENWYGKNGALIDGNGKTVDECRYNTGYYYSRNGGASQTEMNSLKPTKFVTIAEMDMQLAKRPRTDSKSHNKLGILNGNFEYANDSGWGSNKGRASQITFEETNGNIYIAMDYRGIIKHSLLYFPQDANYITFSCFISNKGIGNGIGNKLDPIINVTFFDNDDKVIYSVEKMLNQEGSFSVIIPSTLKGKSGTFAFSNKSDFRNNPLGIDDISFSDKISGTLLSAMISSSLTLFPNPTSGSFSLDLSDVQDASSLLITDEMGGKVHEQPVDSTCCKDLQVRFPRSGTYNVSIQTPGGIVTKKLYVNQ